MNYFQPFSISKDEGSINDLLSIIIRFQNSPGYDKDIIEQFHSRYNQIIDSIPKKNRSLRKYVRVSGERERWSSFLKEVTRMYVWDPKKNDFVEIGTKETAVTGMLNSVYALCAQAFKELPYGKDVLAKVYHDVMNGNDESEGLNSLMGCFDKLTDPSLLDFDFELRKRIGNFTQKVEGLALLEGNLTNCILEINASSYTLKNDIVELSKAAKKNYKSQYVRIVKGRLEERIKSTKKQLTELFREMREYMQTKIKEYPCSGEWFDGLEAIEPRVERIEIKPEIPIKVGTELPLEKRIEKLLSKKRMGAWGLSEALKVPVTDVYGVLYRLEREKKVTPVKDVWALSKNDSVRD